MSASACPANVRPSILSAPSPAGYDIASVAAWERWFDSLPDHAFLSLFAESPPPATGPYSFADEIESLLETGGTLPVRLPENIGVVGTTEVVSCTLRSPDLCLWNTSRDSTSVLPEVVRAMAARRERVAVVLTEPSAVDHMLASLDDIPACGIVDRLDFAEHWASSNWNASERVAALRESLLDRLSRIRSERLHEATVWRNLEAAWVETERQRSQQHELRRRLASLPSEVRREAELLLDDGAIAGSGPFAVDFQFAVRGPREVVNNAEKAVFSCNDRRSAIAAARHEIENERSRLEDGLSPAPKGRWWTMRFWTARFDRTQRQRHEMLTARETALTEAESSLNHDHAKAQAEKSRALAELAVAVDARIDAEVKRRRVELESLLADSVEAERIAVQAWQHAADRFSSNERPADLTPAEHARCQALRQVREKEFHAALDDDSHAVESLLRRLPRHALAVVGTLDSLMANDNVAATRPFDRILVVSADRLASPELLKALRMGQRAVLIGLATPAATPFAALWSLLHRDVLPTRFEWTNVAGRFVCTLGAFAQDDSPDAQIEPVIDCPEVELTIVATPGERPRLTRIAFPPDWTATQAKAFVYRELQETTVDRSEAPQQWLDASDRLTIAWACPHAPGEETLELEAGVREKVCVVGGRAATCRIEFDKTAGWTTARIHDWIRERLACANARRTIDLDAAP
jgi:hypothetical protein